MVATAAVIGSPWTGLLKKQFRDQLTNSDLLRLWKEAGILGEIPYPYLESMLTFSWDTNPTCKTSGLPTVLPCNNVYATYL